MVHLGLLVCGQAVEQVCAENTMIWCNQFVFGCLWESTSKQDGKDPKHCGNLTEDHTLPMVKEK